MKKSLLHILPNELKIAGHTIAIKFVDTTDEDNYGYFSDVELCIVIAKGIERDGKVIEFNDTQLLNTFFHELIHCYQFFYGANYEETEAQVYANFLTELFNQIEL